MYALRGLIVTLQDTTSERIAPAIERAGKLFGKRVKDKVRAPFRGEPMSYLEARGGAA